MLCLFFAVGAHSLMQSKDLVASYGDLDQIFDTSESESSEHDNVSDTF